MYKREEFLKIAENLLEEIESKYSLIYNNYKEDIETNEWLINFIKEIIRKSLENCQKIVRKLLEFKLNINNRRGCINLLKSEFITLFIFVFIVIKSFQYNIFQKNQRN